MSPITRLIFVDAYRTYESSFTGAIEALRRYGVDPKIDHLAPRFEYEDVVRFSVTLTSGDNDKLIIILMAAHVDGDENGWGAGFEEREAKRLVVHRNWLDQIGIVESDEPPLLISNSAHPKDKFSTITVTWA